MIENSNPENYLEILLVKVQEKQIEFCEFIRYFLKADLYTPGGSVIMPDGSGMAPLFFEKMALRCWEYLPLYRGLYCSKIKHHTVYQ